MNLDQIKNKINSKEYNFLRNNEHLKNKIIFLTLGGSHAYGTNIETSDLDIRGCALNSKSDLIGMSSFEQVVNTATDTTIYSFNKLISLILNCNPNTIEMLGCKPEHYFHITPIGQELIDNKKMFLTKKAVHSFGGYANAQLRKLQNALARDSYDLSEKEKHILNSIKFAMADFREKYEKFEDENVELFIDKSNKEELEDEIFMNINLKHYPLRDYKSMWSEMNNIVKEYAKLNHRNKKKDDLHLNKHICHLCRLYLMCFDILEKEEIITYRENDKDFLKDVRNGYFINNNGEVRSEFYDLLNEYETRLTYAKNNTNLPESPDFNKIQEFVMSVNEKVVNNNI